MYRSLPKFRLILTATICALAIIVGSAAYGQDVATPTGSAEASQPSVLFHPKDESLGGSIGVELEPGESITITVVMGNNGDSAFSAVTYAADAYTMRNV